MARRLTIIKLKPWDPGYFLTLCEKVVEQHNTLGASSPLADGTLVDMATYTDLTTRARQKRDRALELYAEAGAAMYESRALIGKVKGQTINTPGTLYHYTDRIKKLLQVLNPENPEELGPWGFKVVVKEAKNRGRKKKS